MRQYETAIRIAQVHHLADERKYKKALTVIQTLDMRQVRNVSDLKVFAEVYIRTEQFSEAKATYLKIYKKSRTRRILYRLIYLAIRTNDLGEAEKYYTEFLHMNPNERDALIVRYRIDKASGVPIGKMIDTLKRLKEEEYIEEWAYELAKLYQQAGRYEECQEECEDIKLWFGTGEIVERAKLLLEHIQEKAPMPFMDDKDYVEMIPQEEPNPDDTGSLPDLSEYLESDNEQEMKLLKKVDPAKFEEIASEKIENEALNIHEEEREDEVQTFANADDLSDNEEVFDDTDNLSESVELPEDIEMPSEREELAEVLPVEGVSAEVSEDHSGAASIPTSADDITVAANTSESPEEKAATMGGEQSATIEKPSAEAALKIDPKDFPRISQSGTGITQDLAKEISAIYEAERQTQLKEKSVTVMQEVPNVANQVVERLTEAAPQSDTKLYTPLDTEEINREENLDGATVVIPSMSDSEENLAKSSENGAKKEASSDLEAELKLLKALEEELQEVEEKAEQALVAGGHEEIQKAKITAPEVQEEVAPATAADVIKAVNGQLEKTVVGKETANPVAREAAATVSVPTGSASAVTPEGAMEAARAAVPAATGVTPPAAIEAAKAAMSASMPETAPTAVPAAAYPAQELAATITPPVGAPAVPPLTGSAVPPVTTQATARPTTTAQTNQAATANATPMAGAETAATTTPAAGAQGVSATGEVLPEKDLPTTRALHRSFADILILIGGEMDPSHFVLMGDGRERILGIAKKISVVMRETGYLSSGRIAHIGATQLNQMDIAQFKKQLKGNCLLITSAAELLFPTITKVFSVMDEFYGDFTVILSDEGSTLDQLFRFVPALSRRFKYVIDISQYTEQDYK